MIDIMDKTSSVKDKKDTNNNNNNNNNNSKNSPHSSRIAEKYGLRPRTIIKRIQLERSRQEVTVKEPRKPKPPPLSKYRRKTANARERHRMKEINEAFATLRGILPSFSTRRPSTSGMTKITTLKLATSYIQALSDVLGDVEPSSEIHTIHTGHSVGTSNQDMNFVGMQHQSDLYNYHGSRTSLSSNSDLGDLLSDDSCVFESNLDAFDDIPALPEPDPFALLLAGDNVDLSIDS